MNAAANFAFANRSALAHRLREVLRLELGADGEARLLYDVAHNIAKVEHHHIDGVECKVCVHRKGATRAFGGDHSDLSGGFAQSGQPVLVPGDMGTGSWLLAGPTATGHEPSVWLVLPRCGSSPLENKSKENHRWKSPQTRIGSERHSHPCINTKRLGRRSTGCLQRR